MNAATPARAVVAVPGGKLGPCVPTLMLRTDATDQFLDDVGWPVGRS